MMPQLSSVDMNSVPASYAAQTGSHYMPMVQGYRPEAAMNQYSTISPQNPSTSPYSVLTPRSPFIYMNSPQQPGNPQMDRNHTLSDPYMAVPIQRTAVQPPPYMATQLPPNTTQYTCFAPHVRTTNRSLCTRLLLLLLQLSNLDHLSHGIQLIFETHRLGPHRLDARVQHRLLL